MSQRCTVAELSSYVSKTILKKELIVNQKKIIVSNNEVDLTRVGIQLELNNLTENTYTFLFQNTQGDTLSFGLNNLEKNYFLNRQKSGSVAFSDKFANTIAKKRNTSSSLLVNVLVDKTSIEVFYNDGETVMTEIFFPNQPFETFSIMSSDDDLMIKNIKIEEFQFN